MSRSFTVAQPLDGSEVGAVLSEDDLTAVNIDALLSSGHLIQTDEQAEVTIAEAELPPAVHEETE